MKKGLSESSTTDFPCCSSVDPEIWESIEIIEKEVIEDVDEEKKIREQRFLVALIPYCNYESFKELNAWENKSFIDWKIEDNRVHLYT